MIKKFLAVGIGTIALVGLALIPAGSAQAVAPVTAVIECPGDPSVVTTSVTVSPGQDIAWTVTGCDSADWSLLTGANPSHGGTSIGISDPYSTTSPADEFVCGTDTMEFYLVGGTSAYINIICGAAAPLPNTGGNFGAIAATSAMLLVLGLAIVLVVRRRQKA